MKPFDRNDLFTKYRNDSLFIEAGAGAGKTQFISDKTVDLIIQGVNIDKIILITFTNKAAEEMLSRISRDLLNKIKEIKDIEIKKKLEEAKNNLYKLNVSTIHSFCNKLLNENSFLARIPFNFTLIDEDEEDIRIEEYFSKWVKSLKKEEYHEINKLMFFFNNLDEVKKQYKKLCKYFPDQDINISTPTDEEYYSFIDKLNDLYELLMKYFPSLGSYYSKQALNYIDEYNELLNDIGEYKIDDIPTYLSNSITCEKIETVIDKFTKAIKINKVKDATLANLVTKVTIDIESFNDIKLSVKRMNCYKYRYINIYARKAFDFYNDNCSKEKLSNNQVIYYAYKLLQDKNVSTKLANKYDTIFVDEFQDTDKYQIKFVDELAKAITIRKQKENIKTTTLVVVGDPKQSIYRFRGADIDSFIAYRDDKSLDKKVVFFLDNFRSNNYIINYLNDTFNSDELVFHPSYTYNPMVCSKKNTIDVSKIDDTSNLLAGVYSYDFKGDKENKKNKFDTLVRLVDYIVKNKISVYKSIDRNTSKFKEVNYGDFLILTHSKSELNEYVKAFNKYDIPTIVAGEFNIFSFELFNLVYSILLYLLDKSSNNLTILKKRFEISDISNIDFEIYIKAIEDEVKEMTPYGVLMYTLNVIPYSKFYIKNFSNSDVALYNTIIHQLIEHMNINFDMDRIHLLNEIEKLKEISPEQQLSLLEEANAVRVMNMHKAKGLEGNIVIIPDSGGNNSDKLSRLINNTFYLTIPNFKKEVQEEGDMAIKQERVRLEYVAASRAQSVLIFDKEYSSHSNIFPSSAYDFTDEHLENYHLNGTKLMDEETINEFYKDKKQEDTYYVITSNKEYKLVNREHIFKENIKSFSPSSKEIREDISSTSISINRPRNNIFGDAMHKAMELLINDYSKDISLIVKQAIREKEDEISINDKETYIKYLTKVVKAIKSLYDNDTSFLEYIKYPEYKFTVYLDDDNSLINGSMDLLMINDNHIKIIDYKSDIAGFKDTSSFEDILKNRYQEQLKIYKKVANKLYPNHHIDLSIIYVEEHDDNEIAHEIKL